MLVQTQQNELALFSEDTVGHYSDLAALYESILTKYNYFNAVTDMPTIVSMYQPIWEKLKTERKVSVAVAQPLHRRIIKAVIKRKDTDIAHKFLLSEQCIKAKLNYTIEGNVIHFRLLYFINGIGEL